jgi:hypothetical protein
MKLRIQEAATGDYPEPAVLISSPYRNEAGVEVRFKDVIKIVLMEVLEKVCS